MRWQIVALLMALCFISHLNRISMSVAADERIMKQYSIAPKEMGMVYSAFLLVYTICMIPGGFFIDRFGARVALMVVGFGSAFFGACTGFVGLGLVAANQMCFTDCRGASWACLPRRCIRDVPAPLPIGHRFATLLTTVAVMGGPAESPTWNCRARDRAVDWPTAYYYGSLPA
jgi:MFS family permease